MSPPQEIRMERERDGEECEPELTDAQRAEIERRLERHEENPGKYSTWDEIRRKLEGLR